MTFQEV